jgi:hypothetical protein
MKKNHLITFALCFSILLSALSKEIPANLVLKPHVLKEYLKADVYSQLNVDGEISEAELAQYFRIKFSERYFYNWEDFQARFDLYNKTFPEKQVEHTAMAQDHMRNFSDSTKWVLPFNYLNNSPVDAYAIRHLARQHKMVDIAFLYYYQNEDPIYINYFIRQQESLNAALESGEYEKIKDGNGIYEAFRSGYRVLNWFRIHNMFLGQEAYSDEAQLTTIATLLQHGANLYAENQEFNAGNHQTRGLSALAMISILLRDFEGTDIWYNHAMDLLKEHLSREINSDGFQFERSVHYHKSDIDNYYYVYQLAKISHIKIDESWEQKLKSLFVALTEIAYPDKSAPVLQDDTEQPWAEKNKISDALTLGYLLFEKPEWGYFASSHIEPDIYWFLNRTQLDLLSDIQEEKPQFKSIALPETGYYIMREGWEENNKMMIISAGLDDEKPDHQHGDMLGIQAMANGMVILPNYQVRYSLKDFELFKNSMVKNVALVDNELQGKQWTPNSGGSGFGKFLILPEPKVITWNTDLNIDLFVGSHNGFEDVGVTYTRQVVYIKDDFWIVKDNFKSDKKHSYKQVWQGHYTLENKPNLIRSFSPDAVGSDILQLVSVDDVISSGSRGKQWSVVSKNNVDNFSFVTVIYPFSRFTGRINEDQENPILKGWQTKNSKWSIEGENAISLWKDDESVFFNVNRLAINGIEIKFAKNTDIFVEYIGNKLSIQSIGDENVLVSFFGIKTCALNGNIVGSEHVLKPGEVLKCE